MGRWDVSTAILAEKPEADEVGILFVGMAVGQLAAAVWVYRDATRWTRAAWWWGLSVAALAPVFFPLYVLAARPRPEGAEGWGVAEVLAAGVLGLLAVPALASLVIGSWLSPGRVAWLVLAQSVALGGACAAVVWRSGGSWATVGLDTPRWRRLGLASLVAAVPLVAAVHYVVQPASLYLLGLAVGHEQARALAELEQWSNPLVRALPPLQEVPQVAVFAVLVCGAVPLAEEWFFRGLLYPVVRRRTGPGLAAVATGLVFGAVHLQVVNFLPIAVLGVAFAVSVERTGSLVPAVVMHAANNLAALVVAYVQR
jgi:membrane protease YdiL (CAAX protease family)